MAEVASAHVTIYPKIAPGFTQQMSGQFDGAGAKSGTSMGRIFSANFAANLAASGIAKAAGGIWSAIKGSFRGGFDRLMNIEQAEIKLKTLGINVEQAMGSVDAAVSGTRFAISDAADMAAFLGASGVDAGEDMTKWLKLTADAAQFMNLDFKDAQSIIGTVAAQGRVTGEELNRLPVAAAALADHLGLPQQEIRKLASEGEITAEQFAEALNSKIGGAASNAGESFTAMVANIKTALNATSANLMTPLIEALKKVLPVTFEIVKGVRDIAKPIGQIVGVVLVPAAELLARGLAVIPPILQKVANGLKFFTESGIGVGNFVKAMVVGAKEIVLWWGDLYGFFAGSDFATAVTRALGVGDNHPIAKWLTGFQSMGARVAELFMGVMNEVRLFQGDWYGFFAASDFATIVIEAMGWGKDHPGTKWVTGFQTLVPQVWDALTGVLAEVSKFNGDLYGLLAAGDPVGIIQESFNLSADHPVVVWLTGAWRTAMNVYDQWDEATGTFMQRLQQMNLHEAIWSGFDGAEAIQGFARNVSWAQGLLEVVYGQWKMFHGDLYGFLSANDIPGEFAAMFDVSMQDPFIQRLQQINNGLMGIYDLIVGGDFSGNLDRAFGWQEDHPMVRFLLLIREHLMALPAILAPVMAYMPAVGQALGGAFSAVASSIQQIGETIVQVGIALVQGFLPSIEPIKSSIAQMGFSFDGLNVNFGLIIQKIIEVVQAFSPLQLVFQALLPVLPQLGALVGMLAGAAAELLFGIIPLAQQLSGVLVVALANVAAAVVPLVLEFASKLIPIVLRLAADIIPVLAATIAALAPVVLQVASAVLPMLTAAVGAALPVITALASFISSVLVPILRTVVIPVVMLVVQAFASHLVGALQGAQRFISGLVTMVSALFRGDWAAAWQGAKDLVLGAIQAIWHTINLIWLGRVVGLVRGGLTSIVTLFRSGWSNAVSLLRQAWANIASAASGGAARLGSLVTGLVQRVLGFFRNMGSGMGSIIRNAWQVARSAFGGATAAIRTLVSQFVGAIRGFFVQLGTNMRSLASSGLQAVRGIFSRGMEFLRTAVSGGKDKIVGLFRDMPGAFKRALGNLGNFLKDSGRALLDGFRGGIAAGFDKAKQMAKDGLAKIRNLFPFSPAKEGPFSGRGYTSYSGAALARDFGAGITSQTGQVRASAEALMDAAKVDTTLANITGTTTGPRATGPHGAGALAGGQYTFNITMNPRDLDQLRALDDLIRTGRNTARRQGVLA